MLYSLKKNSIASGGAVGFEPVLGSHPAGAVRVRRRSHSADPAQSGNRPVDLSMWGAHAGGMLSRVCWMRRSRGDGTRAMARAWQN